MPNNTKEIKQHMKNNNGELDIRDIVGEPKFEYNQEVGPSTHFHCPEDNCQFCRATMSMKKPSQYFMTPTCIEDEVHIDLKQMEQQRDRAKKQLKLRNMFQDHEERVSQIFKDKPEARKEIYGEHDRAYPTK